MKSLKVVHCLVFYLPNRIGGIEIYVDALLRELKKRGHIVKIIVPDYPNELRYPKAINEVPIITYNEKFNSTSREFRGDVESHGLEEFRNCLENETPDIVHFHQLTSSSGISLFHLKAAKATGAKIVYTNHLAGLTCTTGKMIYKNQDLCDGTIAPIKCSICHINNFTSSETLNNHISEKYDLKSFLSFLKDYGTRPLKFISYIQYIKHKKRKVAELIEISDKFIVLSEWYYQVLKKNMLVSDKVKVIRQGLPFCSTYNKKSLLSNASIRLVYIGRISPDKGLHILLKAIQLLDNKSFRLDIFGQVDGESYHKTCKDLIVNNEKVNWFPPVSNANIVETIQNYDLLVLPSVIAEMAPLILEESNAAGVPVVGTNIGGIAEAIQHEVNGWLFEMGDVSGLRKIILEVLGNPLKLAEVSLNLKKTRSFKEVAKEVEEVYFSLL